MIYFQAVFVALVFISSTSSAAEPTGLPLNLEYFMTTQQVEKHMRLLKQHRLKLDPDLEDEMFFKTPDPATSTYNVLHLEFNDNRLVGITSGKYQMRYPLFERYLREMLKLAEQWKAAGMTVDHESPADNFYLYHDDKSYVSVNGGPRDGGYFVEISMTERAYTEKNRSTAMPAYSESCQIADILFGPISFDIIPYDGYETAIVRSRTFDNPKKNSDSILGEITVDRGGFTVRTPDQINVGAITPELRVVGWDDNCDKESSVEIVKVSIGSYKILRNNKPVGTISGRFPENGFGVE